MRALNLFLCLVFSVPCMAQIRPVESREISVNYSKTIHLIFPSAIKYYKSVSDFVVVDNPENVPHARIYGRLLEMCVPVRFTGGDFRKITAQQKMERLKKLIDRGEC